MADVAQAIELKNGGRKRKPGNKKGKMAKKRQRTMPQGTEKRVKVDQKMKKLYQKRARDYNSDDEDEGGKLQESSRATGGKRVEKRDRSIGDNRFKNNDRSSGDNRFKKNDRPTGDNRFKKNDHAVGANRFKRNDGEFEGGFSDEDEEDDPGFVAEEVSEDEDGGIQPGITRFSEGIKAFRLAFKKIVKKSGGDEDVLGPVLSAHKKLIAEKLAEEEAEKKVKGEVKKEKHLIGEKGHVKPANYLDAHEKLLLGVATKGVVKLFNAVNKAQNAQKGLNPSRTKDEKVIKKRRKEAFFSELGSQSARTVVKVGTSMDGEALGWAPLRDNYMLTNPKLKDWDKMEQDTNVADDFGRQSDSNSSSDED